MMVQPYWKRPFLIAERQRNAASNSGSQKQGDDQVAAEAKRRADWAMGVYQKLTVVNDDGMTFANKTAMWVAYERQLESERPIVSERLFCDPVAKYMAGPYGKETSDAFAAMGSGILFDPNGDMGDVMKYDGFAYYHAARTHLISVQLAKWTNMLSEQQAEGQVINLGSGCDTRAFWDKEGLGGRKNKVVDLYVEVDTKEINNWKENILQGLQDERKLPDPPVCERKLISMDFSKESVKDLPSHGIDVHKSTCWILEGLIMYLDKEAVDSLLTEISNLSPPAAKFSALVINFANSMNSQEHHSDTYCRDYLERLGWKLDRSIFFGDQDFSFGRYPPGKPANKSLGFSFFSRVQ